MGRKSISVGLRASLTRRYRAKYGNFCYYCGCDLHEFCSHIDHVIPVSEGGTEDVENLVLSCRFCNMAKMDLPAKDLLIWLAHVRSTYFKSAASKDVNGDGVYEESTLDQLRHANDNL